MSGDLPIGWTWAIPTDIASPQRYSLSIGPFGSSLKVSDYRDRGVPLVFVRNIRSESFDGDELKFVSEDKAKDLAAHEVHPGDVLITKMGDPPGDAALYPLSRPLGIVTADCIRWKIESHVGNALYVMYATRTPQIREQILGITRGVAQRKVSLSRFRSIRYPLAPLPEQRRIVFAIESYFTRLDDAVVTLDRVQRNLQRYQASVLKAAVEGRLVPTEADLARAEGRSYEPASVLLARILTERRRRWEEAELAKMKAKGKVPENDKWKAKYVEPVAPDTSELPPLPEEWCWATIDQLSHLVRNGYSKKPASDGAVRILRISAVRSMNVDFADVRWLPGSPESYSEDLVAEGDLLFTRYNGSPALVGVSGLVRTLDRPTVHPDKLIKVRLFASELDLAYVELASNTGASRLFVEGRTRTTAGQVGISGGDIKQMPIPLAPRAEQSRISSEAERMLTLADAACESLSASRLRTTRLRQSILKWAFEGRLVDQDATDEPASVLLERIRAERASATDSAPRRARRASARVPKS